MLTLVAAVLAFAAAAVLVRGLWPRPSARRQSTTLTTAAAALLVLVLALLAATGRLHWVAPVLAAVLPFARRALGLLRYLPVLGALLRKRGATADGAGTEAGMTRQRALEILDLEARPTRAEIVAAHRRLMQRLHPDRGGSTYLAQQLNEAKRRLLDDL